MIRIENNLIMGAGGAMMAWDLAQSRAGIYVPHFPYPRRRVEMASPRILLASRAYYYIIDRAWDQWIDGHQPITRIVL